MKNLFYYRKIRVFCDKAGEFTEKAVCKENPDISGEKLDFSKKKENSFFKKKKKKKKTRITL